ncbi:hypothetical protein EDB89DRAFT_1105268 [Lactarius sanguifluus]|nr:hypothetical protein EDB89DRAFT_1105268 [Lactarius sanguifluus]
MSYHHHSTLIPISRLPDSLLTDIFILVRDIEPPDSSSPPCLHVSHVCRAWRNAAVHCSLLWTNILFRPPEWTAVMLHRARTAPLTVQVTISSRDIANGAFLDSLRLAFSHIRHIRYLSISLSTAFSHLDDLLSPLKSDPPDILEELQLSCLHGQPIHFSPPFKIAPNLRRSELIRCHTDWKLFYSIGNLTSLVLGDIPVPSRPSIDDILSVLQSMNRLEKLVLIHALPELPPSVRTLPPPQDIVPVRLEYLLHFSLWGFVLDCADIMRYFVMPRCRQVYLETEARWPLREIALAVSPFSGIISSIFNESSEQDMHVGSIEQLYDNEIMIKLFPASPSSVGAGYTIHASLTWRPSHRRDIMDTPPGFGSLLSALPLSQITQFYATLDSKKDEHIDNAEWLRVVRRLSHVKTVRLSGGYTYGFVNAFHEAHVSLLSPSNGLYTAVLPDLVSLTIEHAHFSFPLGDNQLFSTLTHSLTLRQQLELPVTKIDLVCCHITPRQLATLNCLTPNFVEPIGDPETWGVGELDDESSDEDDDDDD